MANPSVLVLCLWSQEILRKGISLVCGNPAGVEAPTRLRVSLMRKMAVIVISFVASSSVEVQLRTRAYDSGINGSH